jgi:hypothetical protein
MSVDGIRDLNLPYCMLVLPGPGGGARRTASIRADFQWWERLDVPTCMREMSLQDKIHAGLESDTETKKDSSSILQEEYQTAKEEMMMDDGGSLALELICNTTETAFRDGFQEQGNLSARTRFRYPLFSNVLYRTPRLIAACERVGLSDYNVAHHSTDMYHHRSFRGAYTKTLAPSPGGVGDFAYEGVSSKK